MDEVRGRFVSAAKPGGFWNDRAFGLAVVLVVVVVGVARDRCNNDRRVDTVTAAGRGALVGWKRLAPEVNGLRNLSNGF